MSFLSELFGRRPPAEVVRNDGSYQAYVDQYVLFQQSMYGPGQMYSTTIPGEKVEPVVNTHLGYANGIYKLNSPVFSVSMARARLFSEMRFAFRALGSSGGGNDLDLTASPLRRLARPGGPRSAETTQSMLTRMEQDVTTAGTAFLALAEDGERILRRRPDWMEFILTAPVDEAVEADIAGYRYTVGGPRGGGQISAQTGAEVMQRRAILGEFHVIAGEDTIVAPAAVLVFQPAIESHIFLGLAVHQ